jgi:hypothetical protein
LQQYRISIMDKFAELWQQPSFKKIAEWININSDVFLLNAIGNNSNYQYLYKRIAHDFRIEVTFLEATWSEMTSNSHSAPHNGETNWGGRKLDVPRGYPGWSSRIEFRTTHDLPSFASDFFRGSRIQLGTGSGSRNNRFGYSTEFFADDWPVMTAKREVAKTYNIMNDIPLNNRTTFGTPRYFATF